jgi:hypothetical protein
MRNTRDSLQSIDHRPDISFVPDELEKEQFHQADSANRIIIKSVDEIKVEDEEAGVEEKNN